MSKLIKLSVLAILLLFFLSTLSFADTALDIEKQMRAAVVGFIEEKFPEHAADDISVTFSYANQTFKTIEALYGELTFKVLELYPNYKPFGSVVIPIQVYQDGAAYKRLFIKSKVEIYRPLVVATRKIKKLEVLNAADLTLKRIDIATSSKEYFTKKERLLGQQTKTIIREGKPIYSWMVRAVPWFSRNDEVNLTVKRGNVRVRVLGRALGDGYLGKQVKVRRLDSRKEFIATVTGTFEVEVY